MAFYYDRAGWVADITVVLNVFFIIGILASLQSVLTLPGIAGIVLTIATSVDANVLIYERIREELADGKSLRMAIADGFKHAYSSIIDSNVATMLLGAILLWLGTGPIKGFAITLLIGIFTSFFCAVFITRLILDNWLNRDVKITFDRPITRNAFKNTHFDFLSRRILFYSVSGFIIAIGIVSMFTRGFSLGVDFKGGRTYDIEFANPVSAGKVRDALTKTLGSAPEVKTITGTNRVKITTSLLVDSSSAHAESTVSEKLQRGLSSLGNSFKELGHRKVGPTIASDIKNRAIWAILLGITVVFFYILIRFRRWQFGIAAVVALAHDVLILLSLFSIFNGLLPFSLEIDQAFIASVLTVMGYSMLDTVVVFDRVREFMGKSFKEDKGMAGVINSALNSTLSRTVITSLTTLSVLLILFIFGGESLKGFSFAMLIGVIFGTYSSIFVATPIVVDLIRKDSLKEMEPITVGAGKKNQPKVLVK
jgi:SecD/SecF fusion protein